MPEIITLNILVLVSFASGAQDRIIPRVIIFTDQEPDEIHRINKQTDIDTLSVLRAFSDYLLDIHEKGYLAASIDSIHYDTSAIAGYGYKGSQYKWAWILFDSIGREYLHKAHLKEKRYAGKRISPSDFKRIQHKLTRACENEGYPFASVYLDNVKIDDESIAGTMIIKRGPLITIDSIIIKGNTKISNSYIQKQTGIKKGDLYREEEIIAISDRISETSFLREIKPFEVEFFQDKADIYTYLGKNKANQLNGILGILPSNEKTGKLLITGDVNFFLINSLGRGESFDFTWKKFEPFTQELAISASYPYIFSSSIGISAGISLLKQDTTYIRTDSYIEARFFLKGSNYIRTIYKLQGSSVLNASGYKDLQYLPPYGDINSSLYGLGLVYNTLDYRFNPRKGISVDADLAIGSKRIKKNPDFNDIVYEGLDLRSTKLEGSAKFSLFVPLPGRFVFHIRNITGYIHSKQLFENELFRLGGIHSLRGVDENSIHASTYIFTAFEMRYLFERNSNFYLFFDGGYYQKKTGEDNFDDTPMGLGAGISLQTGAGIFTISYAVGRQSGNPLNIGRSKIHLGYISRF